MFTCAAAIKRLETGDDSHLVIAAGAGQAFEVQGHHALAVGFGFLHIDDLHTGQPHQHLLVADGAMAQAHGLQGSGFHLRDQGGLLGGGEVERAFGGGVAAGAVHRLAAQKRVEINLVSEVNLDAL